MQPAGFCILYITAGSRDQALAIARALVDERLVACANVIDQVTSVYRWEGKVAEEPEALIIAKTRSALAGEVALRVKELHTYTCPETIAVPLVSGAPAYLTWVLESTREGRPGG